jgi:hypothetical protein
MGTMIGKSDGTSGPQLTWTNVVATVGVICVLSAGGYTIVQNQFSFVQQSARQTNEDILKQVELSRHEIELVRAQYLSLREHVAYQHEQEIINTGFVARLTALENVQRDLLAHAAHNPVESKEVDGLSISVDKRIELVQQQINDINRQIAASVLQGFAIPHQPPKP